MKIRGAVLREPGKGYSIEELELEDPKASEVLVKYTHTGYCHSDLSVMKGRIQMALPMVAGHECAGVVEAVGPGVTKVKPGDHVASTWMIPCGDCPQCRAGMGNICSCNMQHFVAGTMLDGTSRIRDAKGEPVLHGNFVSGFSSYNVVPETGVVSVRKDFPLEQAALMSCCIPTGWGAVTNIAGVQPGDPVAIWGMGGVGLNILRAARMRQAHPIIAVDLEQDREDLARELGATHFICNSETDPIPVIQEITGGQGVAYAFEAIGDPGAIEQAWWALAFAGKLVVMGVTADGANVNMSLQVMPFHHKHIIGGLYGGISTHDDIPKLADIAMSGDMKLDKIVGGKFKLEEINDIAEKMEKRQLTGRWICEWD
jgi:S-(hydroxymethyl)glutathione dehydrogenase / alcohol dehydrogenase